MCMFECACGAPSDVESAGTASQVSCPQTPRHGEPRSGEVQNYLHMMLF